MSHLVKRTLVELVVAPDHAERTDSPEFRRAKKRLADDGHFRCWVCGCTENLEVHHFWAEWSLAAVVDFEVLKRLCELFDIYGYSTKLKDVPITSVDDIRQMMVICKEHHTGGATDGVANGIHMISFPAWASQVVAKKGEEPVPENAAELQRELALTAL